MRPSRSHVVRDVERALALALGVAFAFALLLGAVAPAAGEPEPQAFPTEKCERDEPGLAIPIEPPAAGPSCPSDRAASAGQTMHKQRGRPSPARFTRSTPRQAIPPARATST